MASSNLFKATKIFLMRHPHIENESIIPYNNTPISKKGEQQIKVWKEVFSTMDIDIIYSSDLIRCLYFAEMLSNVTGGRLLIKKELREVDQGIFCGHSFEEIQKKWPNKLEQRLKNFVDFCPPEGESIRNASVRINNFLEEIKRLPIGNKIIIVTHGAVIRIIISLILKMPLSQIFSIEQDYCALNIIDLFNDNVWVIKLLNYISQNNQCIKTTIEHFL